MEGKEVGKENNEKRGLLARERNEKNNVIDIRRKESVKARKEKIKL